MDKKLVDGLSTFLDNASIFGSESEVPSVLKEDSRYLDEESVSLDCRDCGAPITDRFPGGEETTVICQNGCEDTVSTSEIYAYRLELEPVFTDICESLGYSVQQVKTEPLPAYGFADLDSDLQVALICDMSSYEDSLDELFVDALKNRRVNPVITPEKLEGRTREIVTKYPIGNLTPVIPLSLLTKPEPVRDMIESAKLSQSRSEFMLRAGGLDDTDLYQDLNQNPRQIIGELDYTRVFRETEYSGLIGERLEKVCKAGFASMDFILDFEFGGKDQPHKNIGDVAFLIPPREGFKHGDHIFGVVDTKSGSKTNLKKERIKNKHVEYLRQTREFRHDAHIAHIFVVFSMKGLSANEIDWYDAIEREYRGPRDATMVVLYADALAQMIDAHISVAQRNELNLAVGDITDAIRPFFNYRDFRDSVDNEIKAITRVDDEDPTTGEQRYREDCFQRERLLVVTRDMVDQRLRSVVENFDEIEHRLSRYPSSRY